MLYPELTQGIILSGLPDKIIMLCQKYGRLNLNTPANIATFLPAGGVVGYIENPEYPEKIHQPRLLFLPTQISLTNLLWMQTILQFCLQALPANLANKEVFWTVLHCLKLMEQNFDQNEASTLQSYSLSCLKMLTGQDANAVDIKNGKEFLAFLESL